MGRRGSQRGWQATCLTAPADGERVLDVPAKLAARVRLFDTGHKSGWGWTYGVGASLGITPTLSARVDWDRYKLDFGRRFVESRNARMVKADPRFIELREEVLHLIHSAPAQREAHAA